MDMLDHPLQAYTCPDLVVTKPLPVVLHTQKGCVSTPMVLALHRLEAERDCILSCDSVTYFVQSRVLLLQSAQFHSESVAVFFQRPVLLKQRSIFSPHPVLSSHALSYL